VKIGYRDPLIGDLDAFYKEARVKFDADDAFKGRSRTRVVACRRRRRDPSTLASAGQ